MTAYGHSARTEPSTAVAEPYQLTHLRRTLHRVGLITDDTTP